MNKIYSIVLLMGLTFPLAAQDELDQKKDQDEFRTIFGGKSIGGFGGFGFGYSFIDGHDAVTFDAKGGIVLGHTLALGVGGGGFMNNYHEEPALNQKINLTGGYGGFFAELFVFPNWPVHLSFPVLAGIGGVAATSWYEQDNTVETYVEQSGVFMLVEPGVELEFNLNRFMRMSAFGSYRFTTDIDLGQYYAQPDALTNYSVGLRFKFGKF